MKRSLMFCFLSITLFWGCINKNSPEYVVKKYMEAIKDKDWEKAEKYGDKNAASFHGLFRAMGTGFGIKEIKNVRCVVSGDDMVATCTFCCADTFWQELKVKNSDQGWLVHGFTSLDQ